MIVPKSNEPHAPRPRLRRVALSGKAARRAALPSDNITVRALSATRRWIVTNSFGAPRLPAPFSHRLAGYGLATSLQVVAAMVTLFILRWQPQFSFPGMLTILVVAVVALTWGAAPSLLATLIGTVLLEAVVLPSTAHGGVSRAGDIVEIVISLGVGAIISIAASSTERARRRAVRQAAQSEARELVLRETNARTDEFLSIASHELRSPLTSLKAALQLSERRLGKLAEEITQEDEKAQIEAVIGLLRTAESQTDRQNRLVGDLLDVSRIRANKLEYRMASADLAAIVRDAVAEQQLSWPGREITLDLQEGAGPVVADPQRIGQVVTNYLTNALKYSAEDTPVHVSLTASRPDARVAVRDHGPGLSRAQQEHIWERFHRVPGVKQQSGSGAGLGLGLHITRTIVEHHRGRVGVESTPGVGSTFWFTLPLAAK
jgi:signal transduction histidine kinase